MKVQEISIGVVDRPTHSSSFVVDMTTDIIDSSEDVLKMYYKFKETYMKAPQAIWLNLQQAYILAKYQLGATGYNETHDEKMDAKDMAWKLETFMGMKIWIVGRDSVEEA